MIILQWSSESSGWQECIVHSMEVANLIAHSLFLTYNNIKQIDYLQVGNGCTGSIILTKYKP